jgi:hypothetical protein
MTRAILDHLAIARSYASEPYEWPVAPRFSLAGRWRARLADEPDYQVWLHTWLPGQGTGLHQHPDGCAMYVCRGELEEFVAADAFGAPSLTRSVRCGFGLRTAASRRHRVVNRSVLPAVSVHVCAPGGRPAGSDHCQLQVSDRLAPADMLHIER